MNDYEYEPYFHQTLNPKCGTKKFIINLETREILNKDEVFAFGVALKRKYAKNLINKGELKFGAPKQWIEYASKNIGKGDIFEGVYAAIEPTDKRTLINTLSKNPNSIVDTITYKDKTLLYLKNHASIVLPTYCFYIIKFGDFKLVRYGSSDLTAHLQIPGRYFRGLNDNKTWQEAQNNDPDEQMVFVIIFDPNLFLHLFLTL